MLCLTNVSPKLRMKKKTLNILIHKVLVKLNFGISMKKYKSINSLNGYKKITIYIVNTYYTYAEI